MRLLFLALFAITSLFAMDVNYKADISAKEAKEMLAKGAVIVDIRTKGEWFETGVVDGSSTITFFDESGRYHIQTFLSELSAVAPSKAQTIIIMCRSGSRSVPVADFLGRQGYQNIYNMKHGILDWIGVRYPLVAVPALKD